MNAALIAASSLGNAVERIGAYGGLVAMIGLGVLSLLYFAQAREVKRLREWAGRAPERAADIEQRVQTDAQKRVIAQPATPAAVAQAGNPIASMPAAGLTGEAATRAAAAAIVAARATHPPTVGPPGQLARPAFPPAGTPGSPAPAPGLGGLGSPRSPVAPGSVPAAPSASAPGSVPTPAPGSVPTPAPGSTVPGSIPTPAPGSTAPSLPPKPATPTPATANPAAVAAMATKPPTATATAPPASGKPRVVAQPPAAANGNLGQETRESAAARPEPPPLRPPPARPPSTGATPPPGESDRTPITRIIAIVGGAFALVLVVGLIVVLMGGNDPAPTSNKIADAPAAPQDSGNEETPKPNATPPLDKGATTTKVLNGTVQAGLARAIANKLEKDGFKIAEVGDNVDQTLTETVVYYSDGNRRGAAAVAKLIGVSSSAVQPADRNVDVASSGARVVVTVGSDLIE